MKSQKKRADRQILSFWEIIMELIKVAAGASKPRRRLCAGALASIKITGRSGRQKKILKENAAQKSAGEERGKMEKTYGYADGNAEYKVGLYYFLVEKDYARACEWFGRGASLGSADAYHRLGSMYAEGLGVDKDSAKSELYYRKAAQLSFAAAGAL